MVWVLLASKTFYSLIEIQISSHISYGTGSMKVGLAYALKKIFFNVYQFKSLYCTCYNIPSILFCYFAPGACGVSSLTQDWTCTPTGRQNINHWTARSQNLYFWQNHRSFLCVQNGRIHVQYHVRLKGPASTQWSDSSMIKPSRNASAWLSSI